MKRIERARSKVQVNVDMRHSVEFYHRNMINSFEEEFNELNKNKEKIKELENLCLNNNLNDGYYEKLNELRDLKRKIETLESRYNSYCSGYMNYSTQYSKIEDSTERLKYYMLETGQEVCHYLENQSDEKTCKSCLSQLDDFGEFDKTRDVWICAMCGCIFENYSPDENTGADENEPKEWSDSVQISTPFKYTRINNFRIHLQRLQGIEAKQIPDKIIEDVRRELAVRRIKDPKMVTNDLVKKILKHTGNNKYYNNINSIIRKITGKKPPQLSTQFIEELEIMFNDVETNFDRYKPLFSTNRQHFFSYNFIFNKLLKIIANKHPESVEDIKKLIPLFPLLKSREKLIEQDKVWKKVCEDRDWPFYPSV